MTRRPPSSWRRLAAPAFAAVLLAPSPAGADTCAGLDLGVLTPAPAGTTPLAVAVGDFDRNGLLDVATANNGSDDVSILLGNGSGGFGPATTVGPWVPSNPVDIVAGDLDRDGFLDLIVAYGSSAQVRVLQGLAGGAFSSAPVPFNVGFLPTRLYLADFTRDGMLDLVVVSETGNRVRLYPGTGGLTFSPFVADIDLSMPLPGEQPSAATPLDFNRDGQLDLAVVMRNANLARVYVGNGLGGLAAGPQVAVGAGPRDVVAGDVNRDGWPDLVTADSGLGNASVLLNTGGLTPTLVPDLTPTPVGGVPIRVALRDLNHDGVLDLVALDDSATPRMVGLLGLTAGPPFFQATPLGAEPLPGAAPRGLAVGRFTADGRADLVTALSGPRQVVVVENLSGTPCARSSFPGTRAFIAADAPVSTAAADFDGDGRSDLAVAALNDTSLRLLRNVPGDLVPGFSLSVAPAAPTAVATADMDFDGDADVVAALDGATPTVQVFLGNGAGGLAPGASQGVGPAPSALVIGDFDGDGAPDVAATSQGSGFVYVFLGDGTGVLAPGIQTGVGTAPAALVAGFFNADAFLDLAVANSISNNVSVLLGDGTGGFTPAVGSPVGVGASPQGIAAANIDGDLDTDLVTADNASGTVSVLGNDGAGGFSLITSYGVPPSPTAVALLDLAGGTAPDIAVTASGARMLRVLTNDGLGGFGGLPGDHPIRNFPRAITPIDVDADGRLDLAVPCQNADSVVVLLSRPPAFLEAPRVPVGDQPHAIVAADLDGDGDLDLAVAGLDDTLSLRQNDGSGTFGLFAPTSSYAVAPDPESIVAADFNRDGRIDLVLNTSDPTPGLSIFFGSTVTAGQFVEQPHLDLPGTFPDHLAALDFDRDGDLDLAVCDKQSAGAVLIVRNNGSGVFSLALTIPSVGNAPTAIVAVDVDRDSYPDLAVANDDSDDVRILLNNRAGGFNLLPTPLPVPAPDTSPISIAAEDFDGDGAPDLAAAAFIGDRLHVYRNLGGGAFGAPVPFAAPATLQFVTVGDFNQDGKPDLAAVAAGLLALRGQGGLGFEPVETWVAGAVPWAAAVGDFNGDSRPDVAVANQGSDDVSLLLSTTCAPRRLEVTLQPLACELSGVPPYVRDAVVEAQDDGGNPATCAAGTVVPSLIPGDPDAILGGPIGGLPLLSGLASFTGGNALTIDRPGRRYRLQFLLAGVPPAQTRSFTLGPALEIFGPASICPAGSGTYNTEGSYDEYLWTLTPPGPPPFAYTPSVVLSPSPGSYTLDVSARVDGCFPTALPKSIFVGDLVSVTLDPPLVVSSVCVNCIGGTKKAIELGGGTVVSRQWGYRTVPTTGAITPIPGEIGETYTLKGVSFPGPGTYYVVVTSTSACSPATAVSNEWPVTVTDEVPSGEVLHLAATSRGTTAGVGFNRLQWLNTTGSAEEIKIRWNKAAPDGTSNCLPPEDTLVPVTGEDSIPSPVPMMGDYPHTPLVLNTAYCYSVFVKVSGIWSAGRTVKARPFDSESGPVKWAYATGGTAVAPPTVGSYAILAMSNDRTIHALVRGSSGGEWPAGWVPTPLQGVAHSRSPIVPFTVPLVGADSVLFAADDSPALLGGGFVHAVDARTGNRPWPALSQGLPITGAPGGMFRQYGGVRDALFVGTHDNLAPSNELRALNLANGTLLAAYTGAGSGGPIGPISGTPAIAYPNLVYFASRKLGPGHTLFCLEVGDPSLPVPVFTYRWSRDLGDILGSPVLRGGRVYVGSEDGVIHSLDALSGGDERTFTPTPFDGPVKGFLFPDRRNDDLIFATDTKVWSISDPSPVAGPITENWEWTNGEWTLPGPPDLNPSLILYWPQTNLVYVGSGKGELYELDFTTANTSTPPTSKRQILGDGLGQIGAPSLDIGVDPKLLIVGSEPGVLYGVEVPLLP